MNNSNIVNNYSTTIIQIWSDVVRKYENNQTTIKQIEDELNDIYHEIELGRAKDMYRGYLLYKSIKDLRMKRRQAKDENELLEEMYSYIKSPAGKQVKDKIQSIHSSSSKTYDAQSRRTYKPRTRSDLTIVGKTCEVHKPFEEMLSEFKKTKVRMQGGKLRK